MSILSLSEILSDFKKCICNLFCSVETFENESLKKFRIALISQCYPKSIELFYIDIDSIVH